MALATPMPKIFRTPVLVTEVLPLLARMLPAAENKMPPVSAFISEGANDLQYQLTQGFYSFHISSARRRDKTNGASVTVVSRVPNRIPTHMRTESNKIVVTRNRKRPQTTASRRALKMSA
jgi:hypothetical protein